MKKDIHPPFVDCTVVCACGNTFVTKSTVERIDTELCSKCHPFFTGEQILVDTAGQVDRFQKRREEAAKRHEAKAKKDAGKKPLAQEMKHVEEMSRGELLEKIKHELEDEKKRVAAKKAASKARAAAKTNVAKKAPSKKTTKKK
jgi:large subunit ribosomal protein L31